MLDKEKALVVFSGGQDSTTCLFWALRNFKEVHTLTFSYGQRHSLETEIARRLAERAGVDFRLMDISSIAGLGTSSLTDGSIRMDEEKPSGTFPNTFVPGRNLFFLSVAAVYAREHGIMNMSIPDRLQRLS